MTSSCDVDNDYGPDDSFGDHDDDANDHANIYGHNALYCFRGRHNFILFFAFLHSLLKH